MKYNKNIKSAIIGLIAITSFIFLVNFLKKNNFFQPGIIVYTSFDNINGLEISSPVTINGFNVGRVQEIFFDPKNSNRLIVKMKITKNFNFSINTLVKINKSILFPTSEINLVVSHQGSIIKNNDEIKSYPESPFILNTSNLNLLKVKLDEITADISSFSLLFKEFFNKENLKQIKDMFVGVNNSLNFVKTTSDSITKTTIYLNNVLKSATKIINHNNTNISKSIKNINNITDKINKFDIENTITNINSSISLFNQFLNKINNKNSTLGKLITDSTLYYNFNYLFQNMNLLLEDTRLHPKRYFHFSIFGSKELPYQKESLEDKKNINKEEAK